MFERLHAAGLTSAGRLRRHGAQHHRLPVGRARARRAVRPDAGARGSRGALLRQPGLLRSAAQAQDLDHGVRRQLRRARDQLHRPRRRGAANGEEGFGVLVGGGLSSVPRIARDLGIWVPKDEAVEVLAAILDEWREDLRYRVSRVKARLKFMVDDIGPEGMRARVEAQPRPHASTTSSCRRRRRPTTTSASASRRTGCPRRRPGASRPRHRRPDDRDLAEHSAASFASRGSRTSCSPTSRMSHRSSGALAEIGLPLDAGALRGDAVACTGEPHCNFSVTETKSRMDGLVQLLEQRFGADDRRAAAASRRLPARVRAALGRRPRLPGHDRARRRGQTPPGLRRLPARQPRPAGGDRAARVQARPDRGARRRRDRLVAGWVDAARRRRDLPLVLRPHHRRRARPPGRKPAARRRSVCASICWTISKPAS